MTHRLTVTTAVAVICSSWSLFAIIRGSGWLYAGIGAVIAVAVAGTCTRLPPLRAAAAATVLTAVAAFPLLDGGTWYAVAAGVLIISLAAAAATRLRGLMAAASALTYAAALFLYLNLVFAGRQSLARIVPTSASARHLWSLAFQGLSEQRLAPPVPDAIGIALLAAAGIGFIAATTDVIAIRLRSPAIAGLPLLVLFSVPVTTDAKQAGLGEAVAFGLAITGYLAMLSADSRERLRIWGRLVTVWQDSADDQPVRGPDTRALAASGRRIGLAAVSLAIVAPLLLPTLPVHWLFHHGPGGGSGPGPVALPEPLVKMRGQLESGVRPVLTYRTTDPERADHYLQVSVLNYDASAADWSLVPSSLGLGVSGSRPVSGRPLRPAPGMTAATAVRTVRTTVRMGEVAGYGSQQVSFLPMPYAPARVRVQGSWRADDNTLMVYSTSQPLRQLSYAVTSKVAEPTSAELNSVTGPLPRAVAAYLSFASPYRAALLKIARRVTRGARTPYAQAVALEKWFIKPGRFSYNLSTSLPDTPRALLQFLTTDRRGFCQQFAFAMASLARLLGTPSRVAVGYTGGRPQGNGSWLVTTADAHAWPELYFRKIGWLRFEPTPGGGTGQGTAIQPSYVTAPPASTAPGQAAGGPVVSPTVSASSHPPGFSGGAKLHHLAPGGSAGAVGGRSRHGGSASVVLLAVAIALAVAAIAPRAARWLTRRRRWLGAGGDPALVAHAAWLEVGDDLADIGLGCRASESPRAVASRIAAEEDLPEPAQAALARLARAEERARYAVAPEPAQSLAADVTVLRRALWMGATRRARWRARLLPASALRPVRAALQHSLDIFGWLDAARVRVRRRTDSEALG